ncbi:hypothetical protein PAPYR_5842 [Paratrimastix pyriformis]|uniref:Uncharacterized protein n=1 Tax=Paratrimastix pyriformis TaxID=342808 RepID=A0ABQ8UM70_9EUKA|nr:hypothetical protein PAPYR_5842 [Paratrimastix pyriformis]
MDSLGPELEVILRNVFLNFFQGIDPTLRNPPTNINGHHLYLLPPQLNHIAKSLSICGCFLPSSGMVMLFSSDVSYKSTLRPGVGMDPFTKGRWPFPEDSETKVYIPQPLALWRPMSPPNIQPGVGGALLGGFGKLVFANQNGIWTADAIQEPVFRQLSQDATLAAPLASSLISDSGVLLFGQKSDGLAPIIFDLRSRSASRLATYTDLQGTNYPARAMWGASSFFYEMGKELLYLFEGEDGRWWRKRIRYYGNDRLRPLPRADQHSICFKASTLLWLGQDEKGLQCRVVLAYESSWQTYAIPAPTIAQQVEHVQLCLWRNQPLCVNIRNLAVQKLVDDRWVDVQTGFTHPPARSLITGWVAAEGSRLYCIRNIGGSVRLYVYDPDLMSGDLVSLQPPRPLPEPAAPIPRSRQVITPANITPNPFSLASVLPKQDRGRNPPGDFPNGTACRLASVSRVLSRVPASMRNRPIDRLGLPSFIGPSSRPIGVPSSTSCFLVSFIFANPDSSVDIFRPSGFPSAPAASPPSGPDHTPASTSNHPASAAPDQLADLHTIHRNAKWRPAGRPGCPCDIMLAWDRCAREFRVTPSPHSLTWPQLMIAMVDEVAGQLDRMASQFKTLILDGNTDPAKPPTFLFGWLVSYLRQSKPALAGFEERVAARMQGVLQCGVDGLRRTGAWAAMLELAMLLYAEAGAPDVECVKGREIQLIDADNQILGRIK